MRGDDVEEALQRPRGGGAVVRPDPGRDREEIKSQETLQKQSKWHVLCPGWKPGPLWSLSHALGLSGPHRGLSTAEAADLGRGVDKDHQLECGPGEHQLANRQDTHCSAGSRVLDISLSALPLTECRAQWSSAWPGTE